MSSHSVFLSHQTLTEPYGWNIHITYSQLAHDRGLKASAGAHDVWLNLSTRSFQAHCFMDLEKGPMVT